MSHQILLNSKNKATQDINENEMYENDQFTIEYVFNVKPSKLNDCQRVLAYLYLAQNWEQFLEEPESNINHILDMLNIKEQKILNNFEDISLSDQETGYYGFLGKKNNNFTLLTESNSNSNNKVNQDLSDVYLPLNTVLESKMLHLKGDIEKGQKTKGQIAVEKEETVELIHKIKEKYFDFLEEGKNGGFEKMQENVIKQRKLLNKERSHRNCY